MNDGLSESVAMAALLATAPDDLELDIYAVRCFFGGTKPLNASTVYRNIERGIIPRPHKAGPNSSRWTLGECRESKRLIAAGGAVEAA